MCPQAEITHSLCCPALFPSLLTCLFYFSSHWIPIFMPLFFNIASLKDFTHCDCFSFPLGVCFKPLLVVQEKKKEIQHLHLSKAPLQLINWWSMPLHNPLPLMPFYSEFKNPINLNVTSNCLESSWICFVCVVLLQKQECVRHESMSGELFYRLHTSPADL